MHSKFFTKIPVIPKPIDKISNCTHQIPRRSLLLPSTEGILYKTQSLPSFIQNYSTMNTPNEDRRSVTFNYDKLSERNFGFLSKFCKKPSPCDNPPKPIKCEKIQEGKKTKYVCSNFDFQRKKSLSERPGNLNFDKPKERFDSSNYQQSKSQEKWPEVIPKTTNLESKITALKSKPKPAPLEIVKDDIKPKSVQVFRGEETDCSLGKFTKEDFQKSAPKCPPKPPKLEEKADDKCVCTSLNTQVKPCPVQSVTLKEKPVLDQPNLNSESENLWYKFCREEFERIDKKISQARQASLTHMNKAKCKIEEPKLPEKKKVDAICKILEKKPANKNEQNLNTFPKKEQAIVPTIDEKAGKVSGKVSKPKTIEKEVSKNAVATDTFFQNFLKAILKVLSKNQKSGEKGETLKKLKSKDKSAESLKVKPLKETKKSSKNDLEKIKDGSKDCKIKLDDSKTKKGECEKNKLEENKDSKKQNVKACPNLKPQPCLDASKKSDDKKCDPISKEEKSPKNKEDSVCSQICSKYKEDLKDDKKESKTLAVEGKSLKSNVTACAIDKKKDLENTTKKDTGDDDYMFSSKCNVSSKSCLEKQAKILDQSSESCGSTSNQQEPSPYQQILQKTQDPCQKTEVQSPCLESSDEKPTCKGSSEQKPPCQQDPLQKPPCSQQESSEKPLIIYPCRKAQQQNSCQENANKQSSCPQDQQQKPPCSQEKSCQKPQIIYPCGKPKQQSSCQQNTDEKAPCKQNQEINDCPQKPQKSCQQSQQQNSCQQSTNVMPFSSCNQPPSPCPCGQQNNQRQQMCQPTSDPNFSQNQPQFNQCGMGQNQMIGNSNQMGNFNQQMGGFNQQMGGFNQQMGSCNPQMSGFNLPMGSCNQAMGGFNQQMGSCNQQMGSCNQQMSGYNQQMGSCNQPMGNFNQQMGNFNQQMGNFNQQMSSCNQMQVTNQQPCNSMPNQNQQPCPCPPPCPCPLSCPCRGNSGFPNQGSCNQNNFGANSNNQSQKFECPSKSICANEPVCPKPCPDSACPKPCPESSCPKPCPESACPKPCPDSSCPKPCPDKNDCSKPQDSNCDQNACKSTCGANKLSCPKPCPDQTACSRSESSCGANKSSCSELQTANSCKSECASNEPPCPKPCPDESACKPDSNQNSCKSEESCKENEPSKNGNICVSVGQTMDPKCKQDSCETTTVNQVVIGECPSIVLEIKAEPCPPKNDKPACAQDRCPKFINIECPNKPKNQTKLEIKVISSEKPKNYKCPPGGSKPPTCREIKEEKGKETCASNKSESCPLKPNTKEEKESAKPSESCDLKNKDQCSLHKIEERTEITKSINKRQENQMELKKIISTDKEECKIPNKSVCSELDSQAGIKDDSSMINVNKLKPIVCDKGEIIDELKDFPKKCPKRRTYDSYICEMLNQQCFKIKGNPNDILEVKDPKDILKDFGIKMGSKKETNKDSARKDCNVLKLYIKGDYELKSKNLEDEVKLVCDKISPISQNLDGKEDLNNPGLLLNKIKDQKGNNYESKEESKNIQLKNLEKNGTNLGEKNKLLCEGDQIIQSNKNLVTKESLNKSGLLLNKNKGPTSSNIEAKVGSKSKDLENRVDDFWMNIFEPVDANLCEKTKLVYDCNQIIENNKKVDEKNLNKSGSLLNKVQNNFEIKKEKVLEVPKDLLKDFGTKVKNVKNENSGKIECEVLESNLKPIDVKGDLKSNLGEKCNLVYDKKSPTSKKFDCKEDINKSDLFLTKSDDQKENHFGNTETKTIKSKDVENKNSDLMKDTLNHFESKNTNLGDKFKLSNDQVTETNKNLNLNNSGLMLSQTKTDKGDFEVKKDFVKSTLGLFDSKDTNLGDKINLGCKENLNKSGLSNKNKDQNNFEGKKESEHIKVKELENNDSGFSKSCHFESKNTNLVCKFKLACDGEEKIKSRKILGCEEELSKSNLVLNDTKEKNKVIKTDQSKDGDLDGKLNLVYEGDQKNQTSGNLENKESSNKSGLMSNKTKDHKGNDFEARKFSTMSLSTSITLSRLDNLGKYHLKDNYLLPLTKQQEYRLLNPLNLPLPIIQEDPKLGNSAPKVDPLVTYKICEPEAKRRKIEDPLDIIKISEPYVGDSKICESSCKPTPSSSCDKTCKPEKEEGNPCHVCKVECDDLPQRLINPVEGTCSRICLEEKPKMDEDCVRCRKYKAYEDPKPYSKPVNCTQIACQKQVKRIKPGPRNCCKTLPKRPPCGPCLKPPGLPDCNAVECKKKKEIIPVDCYCGTSTCTQKPCEKSKKIKKCTFDPPKPKAQPPPPPDPCGYKPVTDFACYNTEEYSGQKVDNIGPLPCRKGKIQRDSLGQLPIIPTQSKCSFEEKCKMGSAKKSEGKRDEKTVQKIRGKTAGALPCTKPEKPKKEEQKSVCDKSTDYMATKIKKSDLKYAGSYGKVEQELLSRNKTSAYKPEEDKIPTCTDKPKLQTPNTGRKKLKSSESVLKGIVPKDPGYGRGPCRRSFTTVSNPNKFLRSGSDNFGIYGKHEAGRSYYLLNYHHNRETNFDNLEEECENDKKVVHQNCSCNDFLESSNSNDLVIYDCSNSHQVCCESKKPNECEQKECEDQKPLCCKTRKSCKEDPKTPISADCKNYNKRFSLNIVPNFDQDCDDKNQKNKNEDCCNKSSENENQECLNKLTELQCTIIRLCEKIKQEKSENKGKKCCTKQESKTNSDSCCKKYID